MSSFSRPPGILTSNYVYSDKKNPYEKLKQFLLETDSGRTDVVFFGEKNFWRSDYRDNDSLGGLADALAKVIMAKGRSLYATPVYFGSDNQPFRIEDPQYLDALQNNTWENVTQPAGVHCSLVGTRYCFDSLWYGKNSTTNTFFAPINLPDDLLGNNKFSLPWTVWSFNNPPFNLLNIASGYSGAFPIFYKYNVPTTAGPYAIPTFENQYNYHWCLKNTTRRVEIAQYDENTNLITKILYSNELRSFHQQHVEPPLRVPTFGIGTNVVTLRNNNPTKINFTAGSVYFIYNVDTFLIPLLISLGWTVNEVIGDATIWDDDFDVYSYAINTPDGVKDCWLFKRNMPFNFEGTSSVFAFNTADLAAQYFERKNCFIEQEDIANHSKGHSSHYGLPVFVHYVPALTALTRGSIRTSFTAWEYSATQITGNSGQASSNFSIPGLYLNLATTSIVSPFIWNATRESACNVFAKDKFIKCTTKIGKTIDLETDEVINSSNRNPLYSSSSFVMKAIGYSFAIPDTENHFYSSGELACSISTGGKTPTILLDQVITRSPAFPPENQEFILTTNPINLSLNVSSTLNLSITGYNTANRTTGNWFISNWWGEDTNNTNGISFSWGFLTEDFRGGDIIYSLGGFVNSIAKADLNLLFRAIYKRQENQPQKKLVLMLSTHRFDAATPGGSYLAGLSSLYSSNANDIIKLAVAAGFLEDEIVLCSIAPNPSGRVDNWSEEIANNAYPNTTSMTRLRNIYVRDSVFSNSLGGLFAPKHWLTNDIWQEGETFRVPSSYTGERPQTILRPFLPNALFIDPLALSQPLPLDPITNLGDNYNETYDSLGGEEAVYDFNSPNDNHNLFRALSIINSLEANVSNVYFVPPWVFDYGQYLNISQDPVSFTPFEFTTISVDPADIQPYLDQFYSLVAQGNPNATSILAYYKHKILQ